MEKIFTFLIPSIIIIALIVVGVAVSYNTYKKRMIKKMYFDIEGIFNEIIKENPNASFKFDKVFNKQYDYYFETPNYMYYIKVVPNRKNEEICVNNAMKWQLRKSFNDESLRFVEGIEGLIRMDVDSNEKTVKKLYIIYPNARTLLKYINECEMILVDYDTNVYGTNIIPYIFLRDNKDKIKI